MCLEVTYLPGSVASPCHPHSFPAVGRLPITVQAFLPRARTQWLDRVVGTVGIGHFFILLIVASNLQSAESLTSEEDDKTKDVEHIKKVLKMND